MNLFWLKYVSYALLASAFCLYMTLRMNKTGVSRAGKLVLYSLCIVFACAAWYVQEANADQHSPRRLILGTVSYVDANRHRGGGIDDDFQLRLEGGSLSPKFSTNTVGSSASAQPIHQGDVLGVLYRTWDNVPLTIDELQGQRTGWHYRRYDNVDAFILPVLFVGTMGLISVLVATRNQPAKSPEPETTLKLND